MADQAGIEARTPGETLGRAPAAGAMLANLAVVTAGNVIGGAALFAGTMWLALGGRGDG